jgi:flagellin
MGLRINTNVEAFNSYRNLSSTQGAMAKSLEKLSSGYRINRAADDAAGLAISEGLRSQVGGLKTAVRNAQDGVSVVQTAEGALTEVHSMLQRMRDLTVQAGNYGSNGGTTSTAFMAIKKEMTSLVDAIDDIATRTSFNGTNLLDNTNALTFQVGANDGDTTAITMEDMQTTALGSGTFINDLSGTDTASGLGTGSVDVDSAISLIDYAINQVSGYRATLGAYQNRFEHTVNSLNVAIENLSASESRVRDTDMAQEMVEFTRAQILSQAGTSMLAQANQAPQSVLSLLR